MEQITNAPSCRSVFQNGVPPEKDAYTRFWAALISQLERSKQPAVKPK